MTTITAVILTYNESRHVADCIETLRWADEVVVFDSFSTDDTAALAQEAGARVIQHRFENYGAQRNAALAAVDSEWIFFVDADERVPPELAAEVRSVLARPERGWWVPRHNYIFGRLTRGAGWFPDYQMRLLHRDSSRYDAAYPVHELVILDGDAGHLDNTLTHYNYDNVQQFVDKQRRYTAFEAKRRFDQGQRVKSWTYATMPVRHFWWRFVSMRGYIDGFHGLRLSLLMAFYELQTWRAVHGLQRST